MTTDHQLAELVIARLSTFPSNRKISFGSYGELSRDQIIQHIKAGDKLGKKFIEIELEYIRSLSKNIIS
jgi:hypothetical protein